MLVLCPRYLSFFLITFSRRILAKSATFSDSDFGAFLPEYGLSLARKILLINYTKEQLFDLQFITLTPNAFED